MRKFKQLFFHEDPVTRQLFRYSLLMPVLFILFTRLPVQKTIITSGKHNTAIVSLSGEPLAYMQSGDGHNDNIPVFNMNDEVLNILAFLIAREDPRLMDQNTLFGRFWINYRGVSARNFSPFSTGGGSTISQQLLKWLANVKMVLNHRQRTIYSKLGEVSGSYKLTGVFSPSQVAQLYINEVSFLKGTVNGIQLSAIKFFDVSSITQLNLAEQYLLARSVKGIKSAGIDFTKLETLGRDSLNALIEASFRTTLIDKGRASEEDLAAVLAMPIRFRKKPTMLHDQPYLFDLIKPISDSLKTEGNQYVTTLQPDIVAAIDQSLTEYASNNKNILQVGSYALDASAIVLDTRSGEIIGVNSIPLCSLSDGRRIDNHVFTTRPVASTIKPLLFAEGIEDGLLNENASMIDQYRNRISNYSPSYYGIVTPHFVVKKSLNTPLDNHPFRNQMQDSLEANLMSVFGSEIRPLPVDKNRSQYCLGEPRLLNIIQLAQVYRAIITDGNIIRTRIMKHIIATSKFPFDTIYTWQPPTYRIFTPNTCQVMRRLLQAPLEEGGTLNSIAKKIRTTDIVMGKTGTSADYAYGWTILISEPFLIAVSITYWNTRKTNRITSIPVPTRSGAGSCGPIALNILNNLKH